MKIEQWVMQDCDQCRGTGKAYGSSHMICRKCYGAGEYEVLSEVEEETNEQPDA